MKVADVKVETEIKASARDVWRIVSDYSSWNDWHEAGVQVITNEGVPSLLKFYVSGMPLQINLTNVKVIDDEYLEWTGSLPLTRKLLSGVRKFTLTQISESRCLLSQEETFYGVASTLVRRKLIKDYLKNYEILNANIKSIAESKI